MRKKIILSISILFGVLVIWQFDLIVYGIKQGAGQFQILRKSVPVEEIIANPEFPDSLKTKIELIQKVREYAIQDLGLTDTENYTTLYDQGGKTILWNLSASAPYEFQPKTWWFPIVGDVPYKGFFDLEKAKKEEAKLKEAGWDTRIRTVSGWSTLGWFKDPILSNMLYRSDGQLAELIIHELTHATMFVGSEIEFNENLASFIGVKGAIEFMKKEFGDSSKTLIDYFNSEEDSKKYSEHLLRGTKKLDSLYNTLKEVESEDDKHVQKKAMIIRIIENLDTVGFYNERYKTIFDNALPNNAYFMSFMRYHSSEDSLEALMTDKYNNDLNKFIESQKALHEK